MDMGSFFAAIISFKKVLRHLSHAGPGYAH